MRHMLQAWMVSKRQGHQGIFFNSSAKYWTSGHWKVKASKDLTLTHKQIVVDNKGGHFQALFQDVFANFQNPMLTGDIMVLYNCTSTPLTDCSACQIFPMWCALCGVSFENHLQAKDLHYLMCIGFTSTKQPGIY